MIQLTFLDSAFRPITASEFRQFQDLYTIFVQKNSEINLSAIRDENGIWEKHFYDSLLGAEFVAKSGINILDLGSGGGFPALPLALLFPEKSFTALDSVGKKLYAVAAMAKELGLTNLNTLIGRAEELGRDPHYREHFDGVTVRAFAPFAVTLELAFPFLKTQGKLILYRGPEHTAEDERLVEAFGGFLQQRKQAHLPSGAEREIWEITKLYPTEHRFPRRVGIPKKQPLTIRDFAYLRS